MSTHLTSLRFTTTTINEVNCGDLDDFISFHYGVAFEIVADQEMSNNTALVVVIEKDAALDTTSFDRAKFRGYFPPFSLSDVMTDLCNRNIIPEGKYVIRMSW